MCVCVFVCFVPPWNTFRSLRVAKPHAVQLDAATPSTHRGVIVNHDLGARQGGWHGTDSTCHDAHKKQLGSTPPVGWRFWVFIWMICWD